MISLWLLAGSRREGNSRSRRRPSSRRLLRCSLLPWALCSGAILAAQGLEAVQRRVGVASQLPDCARDLRIDIHYQSGRRCREVWKLTSSRNKPEANNLALWMTRPADDPTFRLRQRHLQHE